MQSISRLEQKFNDIANRLTDSWQVLNCYVAPARHGRVCWTFGKEAKPAPAPKPVEKKGRNIFVGINGSFGFPMTLTSNRSTIYTSYKWEYDYWLDDYVSVPYTSTSNGSAFGIGVNLKFGIDFAYPITDKFGMGAYMNIGGGPGFSLDGSAFIGGNVDFKVGLLMLAGDVNDRPFIIGLAPCTGFGMAITGTAAEVDYVPFEIRFGRVTKKHLYVTANVNIGVPIEGIVMIEPGMTIGYHFGDKLKTKR